MSNYRPRENSLSRLSLGRRGRVRGGAEGVDDKRASERASSPRIMSAAVSCRPARNRTRYHLGICHSAAFRPAALAFEPTKKSDSTSVCPLDGSSLSELSVQPIIQPLLAPSIGDVICIQSSRAIRFIGWFVADIAIQTLFAPRKS